MGMEPARWDVEGMDEAETIDREEADVLARDAIVAAGGSEAMARSLARATIASESRGLRNLGFAHLPDYLGGLIDGRIDGFAEPVITSPAPALICIDAVGGVAQLGFDRVFDDFCGRVGAYGIALMSMSNSFTTGELGDYALRLAEASFVALAATSGPALMAPPGAAKPVYCTNPLAFAAPRANGPPLLIDQASSATAFVNLREAAEKGETIPEGWAIDADGKPTTDPTRAMAGALLTFGGRRGANIALMVEVLAAGLTTANWATDAPDFRTGNRSPGAGLLIIAISPSLLDPDFAHRLDRHLESLEQLGVHIPGQAKADAAQRADRHGITLPKALRARISGMTFSKGGV